MKSPRNRRYYLTRQTHQQDIMNSGNNSNNSGSHGNLVDGDNCCNLNHAGLNLFTKLLENSEIIYVSFRNDTTHKPYGIFLDHDKEWVVIALRGTLSLEDCITDAICEPTEVTLYYIVYYIYDTINMIY